jgi:hypothetical protein
MDAEMTGIDVRCHLAEAVSAPGELSQPIIQ